MNSPCYMCPTRKAGCHGACQAYKDYTAAVERIRFERQNRYYSPDDCEYRKRKRNAAERKRRRDAHHER